VVEWRTTSTMKGEREGPTDVSRHIGTLDSPRIFNSAFLSVFPRRTNHPKAASMTDQHTAQPETASFGYEEVLASEKADKVGAVFSSVAKKYDVMNDAMSVGMHRLWKDQFVRAVKPQAGEAILDMAGGTGDIAFRMAERGASVTVSDINQDMLDVGIERAVERGLDGLVWSRQNAEELSFPSRHFDAYTIAFGIRNVTHIDKALAQAHRVLRFGGRFFCLEFSTTTWPGFREIYDAYSHKLVPQIGKLIAGDEDSYRYLIESIRRFPPMPEFEGMIRQAGFVNTRVTPILGGLVAIHSGWKA
jgi:demethylmenaquinone methyltransferase/2-methoxy-6-polyprenyl-1,4-benzoquinol methylase